MRTMIFHNCYVRPPMPHESVGPGMLVVCNPMSQLPVCTVAQRETIIDARFDVAVVLVEKLKGAK
jgi:hypothetical protein